MGVFRGESEPSDTPNALTELQLRNAKPAERASKLSGGEGLFLLVLPNGSKLWRLDPVSVNEVAADDLDRSAV